MNGMFDLFWLFFIISALQPVFQRRMLEAARLRLLQQIEKAYKCRVITLIHRQETMSLLGFPIMRFIDVHDSEAVIRAIRLTDKNVPIDLVLHTPGGLVLASVQIARALKRHPSRTRVIVPHYAMSGGTLIALAAHEIVMDPNAVLGPVDPQLGSYPAASVLKVLSQKDINRVSDETLIRADLARKALDQLNSVVRELLAGRLSDEQAAHIAQELASGRWTHDYPITADEARALGLNVSTDLPPEYYKLMNLYPQPVRQSPAVEFTPQPLQPPPRANHAS
ncbi:MAG: hypothetical protein DRP22_04245 [Verrucomicrobia bacterium]|nr:MAG: hypothetical protein DRP22_04245 [Verrucomicrobiota bacterium]